MSNFDFIAIDFETANDDLASACSLGLAIVKDLQIIDQKHFLIKPPNNAFLAQNTAIHGLCCEDVANCPTFLEIWPEIAGYFSDNVIVAHNAQFDMSVLRCLFDYYSLDHTDFAYIDSVSIAHLCPCPEIGNGLNEMANYFGVKLLNHHCALDDALASAGIAVESLKRLGAPSLTLLLLTSPETKAKRFSELKHQTKFIHKRKYPKVSASDLAPRTKDFDISHPLYGKKCVLTGELKSLNRTEAMQRILDLGGEVKSGVSKKIDFLIVGQQDISLVGEDGISSKEEKAYALIEKGAEIKIIYEDTFLRFLGPEKIEEI